MAARKNYTAAQIINGLRRAEVGLANGCQRPSKAAQVWPSKIAHLAEVTSL